MIYIFCSILFYFLNLLFIKIWRNKKLNTPKGAGILLVINFFYFALIFNYSVIFFSLLIVLSFIYFLDDLFSINFKWRLLIQIITPIIIFYSITGTANFWILITCSSAFFILINTLNFQDGEDLNISMLLVIIFSIFYLFSSNLIIQKISLLCLIFFFVFMIFNIKKENLFFGDSGCFVVSILIFIFLLIDLENEIVIKNFLSVIIFPVIDVFYVAIYRIFNKENLLSRNYYHIYQKLAKKTKWKIYLLPNFSLAIANLIIFFSSKLNTSFIFKLIILNLIFCIILHILEKKFENIK